MAPFTLLIYLLKIVIFRSYVRLPEGNCLVMITHAFSLRLNLKVNQKRDPVPTLI